MTLPTTTSPSESASPRSGPITRARKNISTLEALDAIRESHLPPTDEQRAALRGWSGWGPMTKAFEPDRAGSWAEIGERLEWLLPPADQIEARKATYSAFYTPAEVAAAAWQTLQKLGFDRGRVLEPGCGAGAFLDATPDEIAADVAWLGIERDPTTAAIAAALHPSAEIVTSKLQKATLPVLSVDAVLGNVPFAEHAVFDPSAPKEVRSNLHNYCLWRAVKTMRPGGVAVLISSRYTLDSLDGSARQRIFDEADLLGAVRLPAKVWSDSGTTTVADILVLRRRRPDEDIRIHDRSWLDARQVPELDTTVNTVFLDEPDLVVGQMQSRGGAQYGQTLDVVFTPTPEAATWQQGLAQAIDTITGEHPDREYRQWQVDASAVSVLSAENSILADAEGRPEGSLHIIDGRARVVMDGQMQPLQRKKKPQPQGQPDPAADDQPGEQLGTATPDDLDPDEDSAVEDQEPEFEPYELTGKQLIELAALIPLRDSVLAIKELEREAVDAERTAHRATRTIAMAQRERIAATQLATALLTTVAAQPPSHDTTGRANISTTDVPVASAASADHPSGRTDDPAAVLLPAIRTWAIQTLGTAVAAIAHAIDTEQSAINDRDTATDQVTALDADLDNRRPGLNEIYDNYRRTYGFLNRVTVSTGKPDEETGLPTQSRRRPQIMYKFRGDPAYVDVLALEEWDDEARTGTKNAIFTQRVNRAPQPVTHADTAADAIAVSLDMYNKLDLPTIAALLDITVAQVPDALGELAYLDPATREWTGHGEYLSGNVRRKLAQATAAAEGDPEQFTRNVAALRARQPRELLSHEIFAQLGGTWIPEDDVRQFIQELLHPRYDIAVKREPMTATWSVVVENKSDRTRPESRQEWGTSDRDAYALIELECNGSIVADIKRTEKGPDGQKSTWVDRDATREARAKQQQIAIRFFAWVWEDPDRTDRLAKIYNEQFNSTRQREYDGSHLSVPGLDPGFVPYQSQKDMVYRSISNPAALCGHAVGGGKTTIMGMTAMKLRQLGFANKPMIVVLKSTLEDIAREIQQRIPSARLLVADEFNMSDKRSRALWAKRCATGDYDAVIITHPAFSRIGMHETFQASYITQLAANYRASLTAAMSSMDGNDNEEGIEDRHVKRVEKLIEALEVRAEYLLDHASDHDLYFEHLGVDYLMIDEAHYFKNLQIPCHSEGFSMHASKRATDLDMKLAWLRGQRDRIATLFSGTPISNSMLEMYIFLHYISPDLLEEMGLASPDAFVRWCVEMAEVLELSPDGQTPRTKVRPTNFRNAYELLTLFNERADVRSQEQLGLILPPVTREERPTPRTRVQEAYGDELIRRGKAVKGKPPGEKGDNMLVVVGDGRKAATDPEAADLYDPAAPVKLDDVIDQIAFTYHTMRDVQFPADSKHEADSVTGVSGVFQMAFLDLGTPGPKKDKKGVEKPKPPDARTLYAKIRDGLVAEGVPRHRIRFIHDAKTDAQRVQLFRDCREGRVSVLISSTTKGGVGVNVQDRVVALDHIDYDWKPAGYEQRNGRAVRPGNRVVAMAALIAEMEAAGEPVPENWPRAVQLRHFLTEHSTDGFVLGKLVLKAGWIQQMFGGTINPELRTIEDTSAVVETFAAIEAAVTGDSLHGDLATAEHQLKELSILAIAHTRTQTRLASDIDRNRRTIRTNETRARTLDAIATTAQSCPPERAGLFTATDEPIKAEDVADVLAALASSAQANRKAARAARSAAEVERHIEPTGRAKDILNWHGMGLTFEVRAVDWREEALDAIVRPHGRTSSQDTHRVPLKVSYLSKGQHHRIVRGLDDLLTTAGAEASRLREENAELQDRNEAAQRQLGKPFPQQAEMQAMEAERQRLSDALAAVGESDDPEVAAAQQKRQAQNAIIVAKAKAAYLDPDLRPELDEYLRAVAGPDDKIDAVPRPRLPAHIRALSAEIDAAELAAQSQQQSDTPSKRRKASKRAAKSVPTSVPKPVPADPTDAITLADGTVLSPERGPDASTRIWVGRSESGAHVRVTRHAEARGEFEEPAEPSWVYQLSRRSGPPRDLPVGAPWRPPDQWPTATALAEHLVAHLGAFTEWRACLPGELDIARAGQTELSQAAPARQSTTTSGDDATQAVLIDHAGTVLTEDRDRLAAVIARAARDGDAGSGPLRWRGLDFRIDRAPRDESNPNVVSGWYFTLNHAFRVPVPDGWLVNGDERIAELVDYVIAHVEDLAEAQNAYVQTLADLIDQPTTAVDQLPERPVDAVVRAVAGADHATVSEPAAPRSRRRRSEGEQERPASAGARRPRSSEPRRSAPAQREAAPPGSTPPSTFGEQHQDPPVPASRTSPQPPGPRASAPQPVAPSTPDEQPVPDDEVVDAADGMLFDISPATATGTVLTGIEELSPIERDLFERAVAEAAIALEKTNAAGGHNPEAWHEFSEVTRTDPRDGQQYTATHPHWDAQRQWWLDAAVGELTTLGYQVIMLPPGRSRRPVTVEVDEERHTISLDSRGAVNQHVWGTVEQVAIARAARSATPDHSPVIEHVRDHEAITTPDIEPAGGQPAETAAVEPSVEHAPSPDIVDTARATEANPFGLTPEHPVLRHIRAAVERAAAMPEIVDAGAIDLVAIAALSDFVAAPDGGSLASVLRSLTRTTNGTADLLIPRWLELRPPIEWPHWTRALNQAAQILRLTKSHIIADRAEAVAALIAQRSRLAEQFPAARIVRTGTAGIRLAHASDPARLDVRSQLHRARNNHAIQERTFASTAMGLALGALTNDREDSLEEYLALLEAQLHPLWRRHSVITELTTLADVIEDAGYRQLISGVLAPATVLRQVAARLATHIDEPPQPDQVIVAIPETVPDAARELHSAEIADPVQRVLRDLASRDRQSAMDTEIAERGLPDAVAAVHRYFAAPHPQRLQLALDAAAADDRDRALAHLCWALDTDAPALRGVSEADEIVTAILTRGRGNRIDPREWSRFMITYSADSAPLLAVSLMAWSAELRDQAARPGDLGELLRRVEITTVADEIDSVVHALVLRHRFTVPESLPVVDQDALFEVDTTAPAPIRQPTQPTAGTASAGESEQAASDATDARAPEPAPPVLDTTEQNRTAMTENPPAPHATAKTIPTPAADPPRRVSWETPEEQLAVHAAINAATAQWFDTHLDNSVQARDFLVERLGGQEVVDRVRLRGGADRGGLTIGYAPSEWRGLINHLRRLGYVEPDMIDAGVARATRDGRIIDFFHDRLMFAIRDDHGRIAGFTGRDIKWEPGDERKYMNTRSTPLFDKGKLLLGLWEQRDQVGHAVPVIDEGPLDVAAQLAANLTDPDRPLLPMAACGTAVTARHLDALDAVVPAERRHVFALDSDGPGRERTRGLGLDLLRRYLDFDILALPGKADPAEWALRVNAADQIASYLGVPYSQPALEFLAEALRVEQAGWEPLDYIEPQRTVARKIARLVAAAVSPLDRSLYAITPVLDRLPLLEPADMPGFLADARRELDPTDPWDVAALAEALARAAQDRAADPVAPPSPPDPSEAEQPPQTTADANPAVVPAPPETEPDTTPKAQPAPETPPASPPQAEDAASLAPTTPDEPHAVEDAGPWTRRIQITVTGKTALVSGTAGGDPKVLRNTLKDNGFEWKPDLGNVWKHFYSRKRVRRDDAVQAIRSLLADMDAREAAKASPAPTFPPTPQQQAAIDAFREGKNIALRALAGTGKTSTLRMMAALVPDRKITYVAFNRSIADEAQAAFGRNVTADTMHAFAYHALKNVPRYQRKFNDIARNDGFPQEIMPVLGLDPEQDVYFGRAQGNSISPQSLIRMALVTVKRFRESADKQIGPRHVGDLGPDQAGLGTVVLDYANRIWADKTSQDGVLRFTHDDYLKIWALGDPVIPGDIIFFDEVQDVNALQAALVQAQSKQTVVVGDTYQSIYGFRGARDFLTSWPADVTLPLTQSWRFGPRIAELGNHFLRLLRSQLVLEGNPGLDTVIEPTVDDPDAVLCRTNAGAVAAVIAGMEAGKRVALVNGGGDLKDIARAAKELKRGRKTRHPELSAFASWPDVQEYVRQHEDAQSLRTFVRLVDKYSPDGLIEMAADLVDERETDPDLAPELTVSTAHKAKGREWDRVRIAADFKAPEEDEETGELVLPPAEELRLAYVTVTRAKRALELGSLDWIVGWAEQHDIAPRSSQTAQNREAINSRETTQEPTSPAPAPAWETAPAQEQPVVAPAASLAPSRAEAPDGADQPTPRDRPRDVYPGDDWRTESSDWLPDYDGHEETYRRGDTTLRLVRGLDEWVSEPVAMIAPWVILDRATAEVIDLGFHEAEVPFDTTDDLLDIFTEAGRHGWTEPTEQGWLVTPTATARAARAAASAEPGRRLVQRDMQQGTWVSVPADPEVPGISGDAAAAAGAERERSLRAPSGPETSEDQPAEAEQAGGDDSVESTEVTEVTEITEVSDPDEIEYDPVEDYGLTVIPGITDHSDLARWGWRQTDQQDGSEVGWTEVWDRDDWSLSITWTHDGQLVSPAYLLTSQLVLDENFAVAEGWTAWEDMEVTFTTAEEFDLILEQAGRYGWAEPSARPGHWWLTGTATVGQAWEATSIDPQRRRVYLRNAGLAEPGAEPGTHWVFADTGEGVQVTRRMPALDLADAAAVERYVLGEHRGDREFVSRVKRVLSGRAYRGMTPQQAAADLAEMDPSTSRRAAAAAEGRSGSQFDVHRAQAALQRVLDDDPDAVTPRIQPTQESANIVESEPIDGPEPLSPPNVTTPPATNSPTQTGPDTPTQTADDPSGGSASTERATHPEPKPTTAAPSPVDEAPAASGATTNLASPAAWEWQLIDRALVEGDLVEQWRRGDWEIALTVSPDGTVPDLVHFRHDVALIDDRAQLVVDTTPWDAIAVPITSAQHLEDLLADVGRRGWTDPSARPGYWRLTSAFSTNEIDDALQADTRRQAASWRAGRWVFDATGVPVDFVRTPVLDLPNHRSVLSYVLGPHRGAAEPTTLVTQLLSDARRALVPRSPAGARLTEIDSELAQRAVVAAIGGGAVPGESPFSARSAQHELQRLLDGDPTLSVPGRADREPEQHLGVRRLDGGGFRVEHQIVVDGDLLTLRFVTETDEATARERLGQFVDEAEETRQRFDRMRAQWGDRAGADLFGAWEEMPAQDTTATGTSDSAEHADADAVLVTVDLAPDPASTADQAVPSLPVAGFPVRPATGEADTVDGLRRWLHDRLHDLPREIDGQSTEHVHLVLAIADSVVAAGAAFQVGAAATRVAGNSDDPAEVGRHLTAFADLLDELVPDAAEQTRRWGSFPDQTRYVDQIRAVSAGISWIAGNPLALARARASEFMRVLNPTAVLQARSAALAGDTAEIERVFGGILPPHLRGRLLDRAAVGLFVQAFHARVSRTEFDPHAHATDLAAGPTNDQATATALLGLSAALRDRAIVRDRGGNALRENGAATIAEHLDEVARHLAVIGGFALPDVLEPPSFRPEPADTDRASDLADDAPVDTEDQDAEHPLLPADIGQILRRVPGPQFAGLLRDPSPDHVQSAFADAEGTRRRRDDEPEPGALEELKLDTRGLFVEIDGVEPKRTQFLSWPRLANWIMTGAEQAPLAHHIARHADATGTALTQAEPGFLVIGQRQLARNAQRELAGYRDTAQSVIIDAAEAVFAAGIAPQRRRRHTLPDPAVLLDGLTDTTVGHQAVVDRIAALAAVVPTPTQRKRLSTVAVGDVLTHPGHRGEPFRVTEAPETLPGRVELSGYLLDQGTRLAGLTIWPVNTTVERDPLLALTPIPGSLQELMAPDRPVLDYQTTSPRPSAQQQADRHDADPEIAPPTGSGTAVPADPPRQSARPADQDMGTQIGLFGLDTVDEGTGAIDATDTPEDNPAGPDPEPATQPQPADVTENRETPVSPSQTAEPSAEGPVDHRPARRRPAPGRAPRPGPANRPDTDRPVVDGPLNPAVHRPAGETVDDADPSRYLMDRTPTAPAHSRVDVPPVASPNQQSDPPSVDEAGHAAPVTVSGPAQSTDASSVAETSFDEIERISGVLPQPQSIPMPQGVPMSADPDALRWAELVATAARLGYAVQSGFTEGSRIDREEQIISISVLRSADQRLVELAMAVVELAVDQLPLATPPEGWIPQPRIDEDEIIRQSGDLDQALADFTVPPLEGRVWGWLDLNTPVEGEQPNENRDDEDSSWDTPIFAEVARELAGRGHNGDHRDIHASGSSGTTPDRPRRAIQEPAGTASTAPDASPRPQRAGMAGSRAPRTGLYATGPASRGFSAAGDPTGAHHNRHNR